MLKELKYIPPTRNIHKILDGIAKIQVWTYSDASFNIFTGLGCGQMGEVTGLMVFWNCGEKTFRVVD